MKRLLQIIFLTAALNLTAQHYNDYLQYMFNGFLMNPAYAGSRNALDMTAVYRNQWLGMDGAPVTISFGAHSPLKNSKNNLGLIVVNDRFGLYNHQKYAFAYAFRFRLGKGYFSLGLQGGVDYATINWNNLNTTQKNDPNFSTPQPRIVTPSSGFGFYYFTKNYYFGFAAPELYYGEFSQYHSLLFNGGVLIKLSEQVKMKPAFFIKQMEHSPLSANLASTFYWKETIGLGIGYTWNTSAQAFVDVKVNDQLRIGYGYDYTITQLSNYNSGSHELMIRYLFRYKVESVNTRYF